QWCTLGSVKSQIGHTKAAAGAAGLVKAVLALHHKVLPPATKIDRPNPALELEKSPFEISTRARPWVRGSDHPRRASVSSFGFGGSNFHIALEEYTGPAQKAARSDVAETELVILAGASAAEVAEQCRKLVADLADAQKSQGLLRFLAVSTQAAYDASAPARLALVAKSEADLAEKLGIAIDRLAKGAPFAHPSGVQFGMGAQDGKVAFLFPGQGSQYIDMGAAVAMTYDAARQPWDLAATLDFGGEKLHQVVFPKTSFEAGGSEAQEAKLRATEWAQPGIGATSLSYLAIVRALGIEASAVAGHSFGEVTALHAAGVLGEADMLRVARRRGELMRDAAATPGAMTAVSADVDRVRELLAKWGLPVVVANHNHKTQVVLSGKTEAIAEAEQRLA
ncbi:MAG: acyltransferase domain-containing protein, partial [Polyangiaceae bacterium]|nr:acyltransferase domain-containing protein [Polyangiaceae bacterium]